MLIPISLMILVTAHAAKLDNFSSGQTDAEGSNRQRQDRSFSISDINSNVGSTFSTINPSFNSFNQASGGSNGVGEIFSAHLTGSSVIGAPGSSNIGTQGSRVTFGSSQGSGFNFGSPLRPTSQGPIFNIGRPGPPVAFRPNFQQLPTIFPGPNSQPQASRPFLAFPSGPSQRLSPRFSPIHRFSPGPSIGPNFGGFSSSISSSPIGFNTLNAQPTIGSGSEFSVSPLRSTFQGTNSGTDISQGNLQSSIRLISNPSDISSAGTGFQQPSQSFTTSSRFSDGTNAGTSSSAITLNSGPQIISAFDSGLQLPSQSSSSDSANSGSSSSNINQNSGSSFSSSFGVGFQQPLQSPITSSGFTDGSNSGSSSFTLSSDPSQGSIFVIDEQQPFQSPSTNTRPGTGSTDDNTSFNFGQSLGDTGNAGNLRGGYLPPNL